MEQSIRFPGQYADPETGYHHNFYRDYSPDLGLYIQADPRGILLDFSDPQRQIAAQMGIAIPEFLDNGLNHNYGYVDSNPLTRIDPTGEVNPVVAGLIIWAGLYYFETGDMISEPN